MGGYNRLSKNKIKSSKKTSLLEDFIYGSMGLKWINTV